MTGNLISFEIKECMGYNENKSIARIVSIDKLQNTRKMRGLSAKDLHTIKV